MVARTGLPSIGSTDKELGGLAEFLTNPKLITGKCARIMWEPPHPHSWVARELFHHTAVDIGSENISSSSKWLRPLLNARDDTMGNMFVTQCAPGCKGWYFVYGTNNPLGAYFFGHGVH